MLGFVEKAERDELGVTLTVRIAVGDAEYRDRAAALVSTAVAVEGSQDHDSTLLQIRELTSALIRARELISDELEYGQEPQGAVDMREFLDETARLL